MILKKGHASFHNTRTIHGSGPNPSGAPRQSITVHMQPGDNHFRKKARPNEGFYSHGNDRHCRKLNGDPDYTDPAICPVLYPSEILEKAVPSPT